MPAPYLHSDPDMKWCPQGRHYVHVSKFGRDKTRDDGLHTYCKPCCVVYRKRYFSDEKKLAKRRAYDRKRRQDPTVRAYRRAKERIRKGKLAAGDVTRVDLDTLATQNGPDCALCGLPLGDDITVEHQTPLSRGGGHTLANLALAHRLCNIRKGRMTMDEWNARVADDGSAGG